MREVRKSDWEKLEFAVCNHAATSEAQPERRRHVQEMKSARKLGKCSLPDVVLAGVCANVSTQNDSGIFQETAERSGGTLQFYFEQSRKPKGLLGLRITHKGVVELAERREEV